MYKYFVQMHPLLIDLQVYAIMIVYAPVQGFINYYLQGYSINHRV